jgi:apolipoprotein D and lipocalin family protein
MSLKANLIQLSGVLLLAGCQAGMPPLETVARVDLPRFMGDWYVIANIPTFLEEGAHNAIESYALAADGTIETTFTFRKGAFDGPLKRYTPRGFVRDAETNAEWGMQFVWPFKGDYRIIFLTADYSVTVIGRTKRDYVWLMAREPQLPPERYAEALEVIRSAGYDVTRLQRVPQQWPQPGRP